MTPAQTRILMNLLRQMGDDLRVIRGLLSRLAPTRTALYK